MPGPSIVRFFRTVGKTSTGRSSIVVGKTGRTLALAESPASRQVACWWTGPRERGRAPELPGQGWINN
jgi:hypothetical protein